MTAVIASPVAARQRVDRIKVGVESVWHLIVESYQAHDWEALGYATWDEMCTREFGTSRLQLPREERAETIGSLRDAGLSLRAIEAATGDSVRTIRRTLSGVANATPEAPPPTIDRTTGELVDDDHILTDAECEALAAPPAPKITGIDGKSYAPVHPGRPASPRRKPLPDEFRGAVLDLTSKTERITRLAQDDRFNSNADQIRQTYLSDLIRARDALQRVIDQLN